MSSPNDKLAIIFSIKKINKNMYHNILYTPWDMKISPKIRKNFEKTEVSQLSKREYVFAWHFDLLVKRCVFFSLDPFYITFLLPCFCFPPHSACLMKSYGSFSWCHHRTFILHHSRVKCIFDCLFHAFLWTTFLKGKPTCDFGASKTAELKMFASPLFD